jgi:Ribbon-helix-helix protein, copG family
MKPRVGVYLSKRTAARLTSAAKRRGTTKSAIVEAALNRFLDSDAKSDAVMLTDRLADLSGQIGQLDRDLGIVSEIVALLAVTPELPAATQDSACRRGSARFDEFATQVERRLQRGTSLMQETIERLDPTRPSAFRGGAERGSPSVVAPAADDPDFSAPSQVEVMPEHIAAVREDGSNANFPMQPRSSLH